MCCHLHSRSLLNNVCTQLSTCSLVFPHFDNQPGIQSYPTLGISMTGGCLQALVSCCLSPCSSLSVRHQSTHKQSRSRLLRTCEPSLRLNGPGATSTSSFKFCASENAFTFAILTLCTPHLRTAVHLCNRTEVSVPWRFGTNTCTVTALVPGDSWCPKGRGEWCRFLKSWGLTTWEVPQLVPTFQPLDLSSRCLVLSWNGKLWVCHDERLSSSSSDPF